MRSWLRRCGAAGLVISLLVVGWFFWRLERQKRISLGMDGPAVVRAAGAPSHVLEPGSFANLECEGTLLGQGAQLLYQNWLAPSVLAELGGDGRVVAVCRGWFGRA